jgi:tRNA nucleotidyltransferase (CCA-adding enzyme)
MQSAGDPIENLAEALGSAYPELDAVRAAAEQPVYVVGGAVRDLLLGRDRTDLDLVVVGDAAALAARLGADAVSHERFATAKVVLAGHELDLASARTESYPHPGALPVVTPAAAIEEDLGRRDFTINAMAIPLLGQASLIDPGAGQVDLDAGLLRVLHRGSFVDDPTRAIRAARYGARFGFEPEPETAGLLQEADLGTVSVERRQAELLRAGGEATAPRALALLGEWGLVELRPEGVELAERVDALLSEPPWSEFATDRAKALLAAAFGPPAGATELAAARPRRPSEAVELAGARGAVDVALARALGGWWLDDYLREWRQVSLEIDGSDLLAAGIPQGPALGRGLAVALAAKLDGEIAGRDEELARAVEAARAG